MWFGDKGGICYPYFIYICTLNRNGMQKMDILFYCIFTFGLLKVLVEIIDSIRQTNKEFKQKN